MRLVLHPKVYSDIDSIMKYYEQVASPELADEFYSELRRLMTQVARAPERFSTREQGVRRANLRRFPFHLLFRATGDAVRILVIRHHSRHPSVGTRRR
jgi:plasmid stabilization system protein ParE